MSEQQVENIEINNQGNTQDSKLIKWFLQWQCLLTDVFLVSASLTCLFRWLAYGGTWNIGGLILSIIAAGVTHFYSMSVDRVPSMNKRSTIAFFALTIWIILLPLLMRGLGYSG